MRGMAEWPSLDDVSLNLTRVAFSSLMPDELGAFVRLAWALSTMSVNTYTNAQIDPSLEDDDVTLARMTFCTGKEWKRIKPRVMAYFELRGGRWHLKDDDIIRISRPSSRNPIPKAAKMAALGRAGQRCAYCGDDEGPFHYDHLFPVAKGGNDEANNIVVACQSCNLSKKDRTILEWVAYLMGGNG